MTRRIVFTSDPSFHLPPWAISKFATDNKEPQDLAEAMIGDAAFNYRTDRWMESEGYLDLGPDTLDQIADPASALLGLLLNETNCPRLSHQLRTLDDNLAEIPLEPVGGRDGLAEISQLVRLLLRVRAAAPLAHQQQGRGRPAKRKTGLDSAYRSLARNWRLIHGADKFTNEWARTGDGLLPTSPAARFIYEAICLIDPDRQNLAVDLQAMMKRDIASLPGPRPGRRNSFL